MTLAIPAAPIISHGAGPRIEDRHVERVVDQWLDALRGESNSSLSALGAFLDSPAGRCGGNSVAQQRWLSRVKRRFGERMLSADMRTGNRAKFHTALDFLVPMSGGRDGLSWLAGVRASVTRAGVQSRSLDDVRFIGALTRHCLKRLIQRCGCESATDLHLAFRTAWPAISKLEAATREARAMRNGDVWRIAVALPTMAEPAIFVMAGPSPVDDDRAFFAKTVFPISYLNFRERADVAALNQSLEIAPPSACGN